MEIISLLMYMFLQTTTIGTVSYLVWTVICLLAKDHILRYRYAFLKAQLVFWILPVGMMIRLDNYYDFGAGMFISTATDYLFGSHNHVVLLSSVWFAGFAASIGAHYIGKFKWRKTLRSSVPAEPEIYALVAEECARMKIRRKVTVMVDDETETAFTYRSWWKTYVVVPGDDYPEEKLRLQVIHELMHIKKHDHFFHTIMLFYRSVYWFNLLIYCYKKEMDRFCEVDCDLKVCESGVSQVDYMKLLLEIGTGMKIWGNGVSCFGKDKDEVSERIEVMLKINKTRKWTKRTSVLLLLLFVVALGTNAYAMGGAIEEVRDAVVKPETVENGTTVRTYVIEPGGEYIQPFTTEGLDVYTIGGDAEMVSDGYYANAWTQPSDTYYHKGLGILNEGDEVDIIIRAEVGVKVGLSYDGKQRYVLAGNDVSHHVFTITYTGYHSVFVQNDLDHSVEIALTVYY